MSTRHAFEQDLTDLHTEIVRMGALVETAIANAVTALETMDPELAAATMQADDAIDDMEKRIEHISLEIIALQQPMARDLRDVASALKLVTDLERIADHASDISEKIIVLCSMKRIVLPHPVVTMANLAKQMVRGSLDSYVGRDAVRAAEVARADDRVDELYMRIKSDLVHLMTVDPENIPSHVELLFICKYFERIADHATNVAEWVVFLVDGDHRNLN
jgi:phosphate transport system protein